MHGRRTRGARIRPANRTAAGRPHPYDDAVLPADGQCAGSGGHCSESFGIGAWQTFPAKRYAAVAREAGPVRARARRLGCETCIAVQRRGHAQAGAGLGCSRNTGAIGAEGSHGHGVATPDAAAGTCRHGASRRRFRRSGRNVRHGARADVEAQRCRFGSRRAGQWRCALLEATMELGGRCRRARLVGGGSGGLASSPAPQTRRQGACQHRAHGAAGGSRSRLPSPALAATRSNW